jgi:hypothetical protein
VLYQCELNTVTSSDETKTDVVKNICKKGKHVTSWRSTLSNEDYMLTANSIWTVTWMVRWEAEVTQFMKHQYKLNDKEIIQKLLTVKIYLKCRNDTNTVCISEGLNPIQNLT